MKLTAAGWGKNRGDINLGTRDVAAALAKESISFEETSVGLNEDGSVRIRWGTGPTRLNGDYFMSLDLTKNEIARLMMVSMADEDFGKVLERLVRLRKPMKS